MTGTRIGVLATSPEEFWHVVGVAQPPPLSEAAALYAESPRLQSRCGVLALPGRPHIWIKRDDELSFGASGSKVRKYASMIPALRAAGVTDVVVLGGRQSNNLPAAAQLLTEAGLRCHLVVRTPGGQRDLPDTIFDLVRQLVPDDRILLVSRDEWSSRRLVVAHQLSRTLEAEGRTVEIVPEGGSRLESMPGAMTLGLDLLRNQATIGRPFEDIFVEAGTGLTAVGLVLGAQEQWMAATRLHVLCTGPDEKQFTRVYRHWTRMARFAPELRIHADSATADGTSSPAIALDDLAAYSRSSGVLFDPFYSGRLLPIVDAMLGAGRLGSDTLFIHTGGMGLLPVLERERTRRRRSMATTDIEHDEQWTESGSR